MPTKAAVISLQSKSSKWTVKALKNYIRDVDDLNLKDIEVTLHEKEVKILHKGKPLEEYDVIYAKGSFRYAPILRAITSIASKDSYIPMKGYTFTVAHDKLLTQLELQKHNIPMPKTYLSSTPDAAKKILENINYPIIMKFPQGTQGKGVMFAESFAAASSMLDALTALKQPFLIQEYVETGGIDIRAIVVGDKVVAAMERQAETGEKRANIHAGGKGKAHKIDPIARKIAIDAAKAIGADICAVDILEGIKGPVVIEVNISPGLQEITKVTKVNCADKIARFLHRKAREFVVAKKKIGAEEIMQEVGPGRKEFISSLDFRGHKILLPEVVTKGTEFTEKDQFVIKIDKGKLVIEKFEVEEKKE